MPLNYLLLVSCITLFLSCEGGKHCCCEDGIREAEVKYYNPSTKNLAEYTLDVQIDSCYITKIIFPAGGQLDETHIEPTEIDETGNARIIDDKDRLWDVQIIPEEDIPDPYGR